MALRAFLMCLLLLGPASPCAHETAEGAGETIRKKRTPTYTQQGAEDCLRCHSGEKMRAVQAGPHGNADHPAAPASGRECEACHGPGSIHISRAHGGRGFPPLTVFGRGADAAPREEQLRACLECHAREDSGPGPIAFIGSPHDRRTINCSSCHTVHAVSDAMRDRKQQFDTCRRCHRRQIEGHPKFETKSIDFEALACSACHDVHAVMVEYE